MDVLDADRMSAAMQLHVAAALAAPLEPQPQWPPQAAQYPASDAGASRSRSAAPPAPAASSQATRLRLKAVILHDAQLLPLVSALASHITSPLDSMWVSGSNRQPLPGLDLVLDVETDDSESDDGGDDDDDDDADHDDDEEGEWLEDAEHEGDNHHGAGGEAPPAGAGAAAPAPLVGQAPAAASVIAWARRHGVRTLSLCGWRLDALHQAAANAAAATAASAAGTWGGHGVPASAPDVSASGSAASSEHQGSRGAWRGRLQTLELCGCNSPQLSPRDKMIALGQGLQGLVRTLRYVECPGCVGGTWRGAQGLPDAADAASASEVLQQLYGGDAVAVVVAQQEAGL